MRFYSEQFGYQVEPSPFAPDYHVLRASHDGLSGAVKARSYKDQAMILWFQVTDIESSIEAIVAAGGAVAGELNTIPGQGHVQYAADPEGNVIGLKQPA